MGIEYYENRARKSLHATVKYLQGRLPLEIKQPDPDVAQVGNYRVAPVDRGDQRVWCVWHAAKQNTKLIDTFGGPRNALIMAAAEAWSDWMHDAVPLMPQANVTSGQM